MQPRLVAFVPRRSRWDRTVNRDVHDRTPQSMQRGDDLEGAGHAGAVFERSLADQSTDVVHRRRHAPKAKIGGDLSANSGSAQSPVAGHGYNPESVVGAWLIVHTVHLNSIQLAPPCQPDQEIVPMPGAETQLHWNLKRLALIWAQQQGYSVCGAEVRLPRSAFACGCCRLPSSSQGGASGRRRSSSVNSPGRIFSRTLMWPSRHCAACGTGAPKAETG